MIATRDATEVATRTNISDDALDRLMDEAPEPSVVYFSDKRFGTASECAADARFVKRMTLIVVPTLLLISLLTLVLARVGS